MIVHRHPAPVFFLVVFIFASCRYPSGDSSEKDRSLTVRTVISSSGGAGTADLTVYTENGKGDVVTGAIVLAATNTGSVSRIAFNPETYSYNTKTEIPSDGVFKFSVQSSLVEDKIKYSITHIPLKSAPCITIFRDAEGKSVLEGERVSASEDIQIAWDSVYSGTVYKVSIKTALLTIYSVSTKALQVTVPAAVLSQNKTYYAQIEAQYINGDPLFETADYYSVSVYDGANVSFTTE
jgi:hypothetical protein